MRTKTNADVDDAAKQPGRLVNLWLALGPRYVATHGPDMPLAADIFSAGTQLICSAETRKDWYEGLRSARRAASDEQQLLDCLQSLHDHICGC